MSMYVSMSMYVMYASSHVQSLLYDQSLCLWMIAAGHEYAECVDTIICAKLCKLSQE